MNYTSDGQKDLFDRMGVPFVGIADVNSTHRERFGLGLQRVADSLWVGGGKPTRKMRRLVEMEARYERAMLGWFREQKRRD